MILGYRYRVLFGPDASESGNAGVLVQMRQLI